MPTNGENLPIQITESEMFQSNTKKKNNQLK